MITLSNYLETRPLGTRTMELDLTNYQGQGTIEINGSNNELLIVRVAEMNPTIEGVGVKLTGSIRPENIIWHFPNAYTLRLAFSGVNPYEYGEHLGMPGTFLAPHAEVSFQNALITGALYSRKITALADRAACNNLVSGQINPGRLRLPSTVKPPGKGQAGGYFFKQLGLCLKDEILCSHQYSAQSDSSC